MNPTGPRPHSLDQPKVGIPLPFAYAKDVVAPCFKLEMRPPLWAVLVDSHGELKVRPLGPRKFEIESSHLWQSKFAVQLSVRFVRRQMAAFFTPGFAAGRRFPSGQRSRACECYRSRRRTKK